MSINSTSDSRLCAGLGIGLSQPSCVNINADENGQDESRRLGPMPTLRSRTAMQGLLLAEVGDSMVEIDPFAGGSGLREGQRIAPGSVALGVGARPRRSHASTDMCNLSRHGTLLSAGVPPARNAAELKSLLGNSKSRLRAGAVVLPPPGGHGPLVGTHTRVPVVLEKAKSRARVEVDIILESNACVQGNYLKGHVKLRIQKRSRKEPPVLLAGGKIRVVGFECIPQDNDRHIFYQCAAALPDIAPSFDSIHAGSVDLEGFVRVTEGQHILPFAMLLPVDDSLGRAKGVLPPNSGVSIQYIAMVSIKAKDTDTGKRSIAHFYRSCEIWPHLNPAIILAAAPRPLQSTVAKTLFMGGSGKLKLTGILHRLHHIAGQRCYIRVHAVNDTKKTMKTLTLTLLRTTIVFRPKVHLDALPTSATRGADLDACQTMTAVKQVAETTLEMGQYGQKGYASAKGWWTGVGPGEEVDFSHFIVLPPDVLSVTRARLLEVEYSIRVNLSAGSFSEVGVVLPVRIVNFLSVDSPSSASLTKMRHPTLERALPTENSGNSSRPHINEIFQPGRWDDLGVDHTNEGIGPNSKGEVTSVPIGAISGPHEFHEAIPVKNSGVNPSVNSHSQLGTYCGERYDDEDWADNNDDEDDMLTPSSDDRVLNDLSSSDSDEELAFIVRSARVDGDSGENAMRFSDLYYAEQRLIEHKKSAPMDHTNRKSLGLRVLEGSGNNQLHATVARDCDPRSAALFCYDKILDSRSKHSQGRTSQHPTHTRERAKTLSTSTAKELMKLSTAAYGDRPSPARTGASTRRSLGPRAQPSSFALRVQEKLHATAVAQAGEAAGALPVNNRKYRHEGSEEWIPRTRDVYDGPTQMIVTNPDPASATPSLITNSVSVSQELDDIEDAAESKISTRKLPRPPSKMDGLAVKNHRGDGASLGRGESMAVGELNPGVGYQEHFDNSGASMRASSTISRQDCLHRAVGDIYAESTEVTHSHFAGPATTTIRPSLVMEGREKQVSTNSVKAKILELEQRVREAGE